LFPCIFVSPRVIQVPNEDAQRYSNLRRKGREELVVEALSLLDGSIKGVEVLTWTTVPILHASRANSLPFPLVLLGDGAVQLARLILAIGEAENGMVLVDEIGYGFHYSAQNDVWRIVGRAARLFNTQVVATTHSFELVEAAHRAFSEEAHYEDFQYVRLDRINGKVIPVYYDKEQLESAVSKGFEVR
jgi:AAA15 family ATPase/GTPase